MTLEEMKLAVCEKLPCIFFFPPWIPHWIDFEQPVHWPTEGLQVCHEAEKVLTDETTYREILGGVCQQYSAAIHATYEQRLEALCRVWFPERFK